MRANNILGILYSNSYDASLPELTALRTMGSVPFGGRYRMIDFPLSNMVGSGIGKVGVITKTNYRSLMDHLALGNPWDLSRKNEGMVLLPPFAEAGAGGNQTRMEGLRGASEFLRHSKEEYVIMSDCNVVCNLDYRALFRCHVQSGADLTIAFRRGPAPKLETMRLSLDGGEYPRVTQIRLSGAAEADTAYSLNIFILRKSLLERLIQEAAGRGDADFEREVIRPRLQSLRVHGAEVTDYARVIDSLQSYYDISMELLDPASRQAFFHPGRPIFTKVQDDMPTIYGLGSSVRNCLVADGCQIDGVAENCILSRGVRIEKGARARGCILMQGTYVGADTKLDCVITDKKVFLSSHKTLAGDPKFPVYLGKNIAI
ncbi:MAG: glucose-1-phosphate adenylyltransferase subunit GlgD [Oscillospiraceae bacterium]|jgi:glucose-1-phosphate adenylyltransferase|nr:glucose-1-phosphate adenylyltransferase subunit GlgD [Oscillospiraceae bacterium]